jgi:RND superfamily putative drug exporter
MKTQKEARVASLSAETEAHAKDSLRRRMWLAYGRAMHRGRWIVIALWLVVVMSGGALVPQLFKHMSMSNSPVGEGGQVDTLLAQKFKQAPSSALMVFQSTSTPVSDPAYQQEVRQVMQRLKAYSAVRDVQVGGTGQDGRTTYLFVAFNKDPVYMGEHMTDLRNYLPDAQEMTPARVYFSGQVAINDALGNVIQSDVIQAEEISMPIVLVVLIIIFGTLSAALLPLSIAMIAIPMTMALLYVELLLGVKIEPSTMGLIDFLALGLSIDYSLLFVRRFREELARDSSASIRDTVANTMATAGESILFSGLIVMVGIGGLLLISLPETLSGSLTGITTVFMAMLSTLTLVPALVAVLGRRVNSLRVPFLWRLTMLRGQEGGAQQSEQSFWHRLAMGVMRHPWQVMLLTLVLLGVLIWPAFSLQVGSTGLTSLPGDQVAVQGIEIFNAQFPEQSQQPVIVMASVPQGRDLLSLEHLRQLAAYSDWLAQQPHVTGVISLMHVPAQPGSPQISEEQLIQLYTSGAYKSQPALASLVTTLASGTTAEVVVNVDNHIALDSAEYKAIVNSLRANRSQAQGLSVLVGGAQADSMDHNDALYQQFPKAILFILLSTFVLLMLMFRSIALPFKAIFMNVLSVAVALGAMVFIFQWGNLSGLFHFTSLGYLDSEMPVWLFCILFGVSMDYEVFLLSRVAEEYRLTGENQQAVARGMTRTGGVITNAALLVIIISAAFVFNRLAMMKEWGVGLAIAVLVDATIIRMLLVPATMRLLGKWNWWWPFGRTLTATTESDNGERPAAADGPAHSGALSEEAMADRSYAELLERTSIK